MGLGSGFNGTLAFGYMVSDNIGLELGVNEFFGLTKKTKYENANGTNTEERKISGKMLQIVPAIIITPALEKLNPYARIGMIVGVLPSFVQKYNTTYNTIPELKAISVEEYKEKNYGGIAVGFTAAAGATLAMGDKISIFGELIFNGITYSPTKGKVKEWTIDGVDRLATATTREKEWTFEKKLDDNENIPDSNPDKYPKTSLNFSNVELNIGIKLNL
jgi:hypothetical protein